MDIESYLQTIEISKKSLYIKPTFGIHPWEASKYANKLSGIDKYLQQTPLIGESGLDFYFIEDKSQYASQRLVFEYQCEWASKLGKMMNLHTKGAEIEVLETLNHFKIKHSIIHWYSGPNNSIELFLSAGCYFTVGVEIISSREIQSIAKQIPIDRLLLETDNPGGYEWLKKSIGMPIIIYDVLNKTAQVKKMDYHELEIQLNDNWDNLTSGIKEFEEPK